VSVISYLSKSADVLQKTASPAIENAIDLAVKLCTSAIVANRPILVCGNGGSAADALHITGELVGRFLKERRAINAICLNSNISAITAWANDYNYEDVFARQVEAHGQPGGVLICLSTSGNSPNVIQAARRAKQSEMLVVSMTGETGGGLRSFSDALLAVPSRDTPLIQQVHIALYHYMCAEIEANSIARS
jgi:D-sedoheptulose 7-phosphate isomerase